jgi:hypothetical protein
MHRKMQKHYQRVAVVPAGMGVQSAGEAAAVMGSLAVDSMDCNQVTGECARIHQNWQKRNFPNLNP